jgi:hypothetical protein
MAGRKLIQDTGLARLANELGRILDDEAPSVIRRHGDGGQIAIEERPTEGLA